MNLRILLALIGGLTITAFVAVQADRTFSTVCRKNLNELSIEPLGILSGISSSVEAAGDWSCEVYLCRPDGDIVHKDKPIKNIGRDVYDTLGKFAKWVFYIAVATEDFKVLFYPDNTSIVFSGKFGGKSYPTVYLWKFDNSKDATDKSCIEQYCLVDLIDTDGSQDFVDYITMDESRVKTTGLKDIIDAVIKDRQERKVQAILGDLTTALDLSYRENELMEFDLTPAKDYFILDGSRPRCITDYLNGKSSASRLNYLVRMGSEYNAWTADGTISTTCFDEKYESDIWRAWFCLLHPGVMCSTSNGKTVMIDQINKNIYTLFDKGIYEPLVHLQSQEGEKHRQRLVESRQRAKWIECLVDNIEDGRILYIYSTWEESVSEDHQTLKLRQRLQRGFELGEMKLELCKFEPLSELYWFYKWSPDLLAKGFANHIILRTNKWDSASGSVAYMTKNNGILLNEYDIEAMTIFEDTQLEDSIVFGLKKGLLGTIENQVAILNKLGEAVWEPLFTNVELTIQNQDDFSTTWKHTVLPLFGLLDFHTRADIADPGTIIQLLPFSTNQTNVTPLELLNATVKSNCPEYTSTYSTRWKFLFTSQSGYTYHFGSSHQNSWYGEFEHTNSAWLAWLALADPEVTVVTNGSECKVDQSDSVHTCLILKEKSSIYSWVGSVAESVPPGELELIRGGEEYSLAEGEQGNYVKAKRSSPYSFTGNFCDEERKFFCDNARNTSVQLVDFYEHYASVDGHTFLWNIRGQIMVDNYATRVGPVGDGDSIYFLKVSDTLKKEDLREYYNNHRTAFSAQVAVGQQKLINTYWSNESKGDRFGFWRKSDDSVGVATKAKGMDRFGTMKFDTFSDILKQQRDIQFKNAKDELGGGDERKKLIFKSWLGQWDKTVWRANPLGFFDLWGTNKIAKEN